jgi:hypothetical protein
MLHMFKLYGVGANIGCTDRIAFVRPAPLVAARWALTVQPAPAQRLQTASAYAALLEDAVPIISGPYVLVYLRRKTAPANHVALLHALAGLHEQCVASLLHRTQSAWIADLKRGMFMHTVL